MVRLRFYIFLVVISFFTGPSLAAQQVGPTTEEVYIPGLNDSVEILRDEWGVPHIYATNTYDLVFAQGYVHAQDRWWQMEFYRHVASGRIQELIGQNDSLMGTDAYLRTLGFRDLAEQELFEVYTEEDRYVLQAFADGINAYILSHSPGELAYEYLPLRFNGVNPEILPWTPVDTIIWGKMMALNLGGNEDTERYLSRLKEEIDEELFADYVVDPPYGEKPTILFPEDLPANAASAQLPSSQSTINMDAGLTGVNTQLIAGFEYTDFSSLVFGPGIGSNNWVASGALTESGLPLLANDMHLGLSMPSIWYEIGLHCVPVNDACPYNVTGFTFSPSPLVTAGHNDNIAWAHTNVGPDTQDLYMIRVNPDNPLQYEWDGEWRDMTTRDEIIRFGNDAEPVPFTIRLTHLGPIINDQIGEFNNADPLALRWTALEQGSVLRAVRLINVANNWDEFRYALSFWDVPSQNIIYADIEGNIGYQMPGQIPIRAENHSGELPMPGWTSEFEWRGYIPYEMLPRITNPARGHIVTANQVVVPLEFYDYLATQLDPQFGSDSTYFIHRRYAYGYRADRINTLIESLAPHSADTFRQMHGDNYDGSAAELIPYFAALDISDSGLAEIRDWLVQWDYQMHKGSPEAALWANVWVALIQEMYVDQLGDIVPYGSNSVWWATNLLMQDSANRWWDNVNTVDSVETRDDILLRALEAGYARAQNLLGDDRSTWAWGKLHTTTFVNAPLGQSGITAIELAVNRGPFSTSGTGSAINATGWNASSGNFSVPSGPSERVIYDLSDWDQSLSMHTTGQSGKPDSVHYDDMIESWLNIEYKPMLWSRAQVEEQALSQVVLIPSNS